MIKFVVYLQNRMESIMMKRMISVILLSAILISAVFGIVSAEGEPSENTINTAAKSLFGMYTKQTGDMLRDSYHKAVADNTDENITALAAAINNLKPLNTYTHMPLIGFKDISADDINNMLLNSGTIQQSEGIVSMVGPSLLRYCNAGSEGIVGASPFGIATDTCDGIAIKISSSSDSSLDLSIGKRGTDEDCTFNIFDIFISEGESYYFFPFDSFGKDIPSDGTLNYISLSFTGTESVSFGDFHAVANSAETAVNEPYEPEMIKGAYFDPEDYYRIYQKDSKLALTLSVSGGGTKKEISFTQEDLSDRAQEWQIVSVDALRNKRLIINRKYGYSLYITNSSLILDAASANLHNLNYGWNISYKVNKGFSIDVSGVGRLAYVQSSAKVYAMTSAVKYFDIYHIPGERWNQSWSDEFNGNYIDRSVWTVMNAKNRDEYEPMYNADKPDNLYIEDGNLVIHSRIEEYKGYHATSAYVDTQGKVLFSYGRIEMRAKLPQGEHIWPALWMMGDQEAWPNCGEIDIVEMVGGESTTYRGDTGVIGTLHYPNGDGFKNEAGGIEHGTLFNSSKLADDYHLYSFEWDSQYMRWYFDNILYFAEPIDTDQEKYTFTNNPMYLILDTSIEGPGDNQLPEGLPSESKFYIDYIRYFKEEHSAAPEDYTHPKPVNSSLHTSPFGLNRGASYSRDNDVFCLTSYSNRCPIYDMKTGRLIRELRSPQGGWVMSSALSPNGQLVAIAQEIGALTMMNFRTNQTIWKSKYPFRTAIMDFSADGNDLIIGTRPTDVSHLQFAKQLHIYSVENGDEKKTLDIPSATSELKVSKSGFLALGCCDGTLRLYSPLYELLKEYKADDTITSFTFSPDGNTLYAGTATGSIIILNPEKDTRVITPVVVNEIYSMDISPDGKTIAVAYGDSNIRLFDESTGKLINRTCVDFSALRCISYSPDGKMILVSGSDGFVKILSSDINNVLAAFYNPNREHTVYTDATFNSDCTKIFAAANTTDFYSIGVAWNVPTGLISESEEADFTPLLNSDIYVDELKYTSESYSAYLAALKNADNILQNKYSPQQAIDSAAKDLTEAISLLEEKPDVMKGDFDYDGEITVADALAALRIAAKLVEEDALSIEIGDIDADNHVTVADALAILRVAAKLTDTL